MGLFSKNTLDKPVFLKEDSTAPKQLAALEAFFPHAPAVVKEKLEQDIKMLSAGIHGEKTISYELQNSHLPMYILHDLYLEYEGLTAQIDYLLVTRKCCLVIECKNMLGDIEINERGDFYRCYQKNGRWNKTRIYSPVTQNQRHMELVKAVHMNSASGAFARARAERTFEETYFSLVVLSNPNSGLRADKAPENIKAQVIHGDHLTEYLRRMNESCRAGALSDREMRERAERFLALHNEREQDYLAKYGCAQTQPGGLDEPERRTPELDIIKPPAVKPEKRFAKPEKIPVKPLKSSAESGKAAGWQVPMCPRCGSPMVLRKSKKGENIGEEFWGCSKFPHCWGTIKIGKDSEKAAAHESALNRT